MQGWPEKGMSRVIVTVCVREGVVRRRRGKSLAVIVAVGLEQALFKSQNVWEKNLYEL